MTPQPLASQTLGNQLTLNLFDASRKMLADRWQIELVLRIDVPVSEACFGGELPPPAPQDELIAALGETTRFEYRDRRTFVDAAEKAALMARMQAALLDMAPRYYGHPEFAARFITKKYLESRKKGRVGRG